MGCFNINFMAINLSTVCANVILGCTIQIHYLDGQALFCVQFMLHLLYLLSVDSMVQPRIPVAS